MGIVVISLSAVVTQFLRDLVQNYIPMRKPPQGHATFHTPFCIVYIQTNVFPFWNVSLDKERAEIRRLPL